MVERTRPTRVSQDVLRPSPRHADGHQRRRPAHDHQGDPVGQRLRGGVGGVGGGRRQQEVVQVQVQVQVAGRPSQGREAPQVRQLPGQRRRREDRQVPQGETDGRTGIKKNWHRCSTVFSFSRP